LDVPWRVKVVVVENIILNSSAFELDREEHCWRIIPEILDLCH
jgi:hypothetical protein